MVEANEESPQWRLRESFARFLQISKIQLTRANAAFENPSATAIITFALKFKFPPITPAVHHCFLIE
jgi:hypothetical protein